MLRRLLREALFHSHKPRRHHAALLIAASPYAPAAARHLLQLACDTNDLLAARAWTVLMRVGNHSLRDQVVRRAVVDERPSVRSRALVNAGLDGHLTEEQCSTIATRYGEGKAIEQHATLFALGMAGAPELTSLADSDDPETCRAAKWWIAQGKAIHDPDGVGSRP